jgi:hypothetical protein
MSSEPVKAVLADIEEEMIRDGIFARTDPKLWDEITPYRNFEILPRAFIDDQTGVLISLYEFQGAYSCDQTASDPFPRCMIFDTERLEIGKGHYVVYDPPLVAIPMISREAKLYFENLEKLRGKIKDILQNKKGQKLLIIYDSYNETMKIYENFEKIETLRFPTAFRIELLGEFLHVAHVPRVGERIPYEIIKNVEIHYFKVKFYENVVRFKIYTMNGQAELIYNQNDDNVLAVISLLGLEDYSFYLEPHKLYLFSGLRPEWARGEREEKFK